MILSEVFLADDHTSESDQKSESLDGVHFRCATQDLRHQWTDLDETLGVYRVHPDIMQRHKNSS